MDERNKVVSMLDCIVISEFLVAAVALIFRVEQNEDRKRKGGISADFVAFFKGGISRGIVNYKDVDVVVIPKFDGNSENYIANRLFSVVGNDENEHS